MVSSLISERTWEPICGNHSFARSEICVTFGAMAETGLRLTRYTAGPCPHRSCVNLMQFVRDPSLRKLGFITHQIELKTRLNQNYWRPGVDFPDSWQESSVWAEAEEACILLGAPNEWKMVWSQNVSLGLKGKEMTQEALLFLQIILLPPNLFLLLGQGHRFFRNFL